jgi:hypothetical protein
MIPKPNILKGETKEFIDIYKAITSPVWESIVRQFYSQPFTRKVIEYFDNWGIKTPNPDFYDNGEYWIEFDEDTFTCGWLDSESEKVLIAEFNCPDTFSQFITLLKLSDINIIWKDSK